MSEMKSHGERREDDKDLQLTSNFFSLLSLTHSHLSYSIKSGREKRSLELHTTQPERLRGVN